jgi:HEAT repeat protein
VIVPRISSTNAGEARQSVAKAVAKLTADLDSPPFEYTLYWANDYDSLFSDQFVRSGDLSRLLEVARTSGRVIIHAPAGAGKTRVLLALFAETAEKGLPVFVDLRNWRPELFDRWDEYVSNRVRRVGLILEELGEPPVDEATLSAIESDDARYVLVDGLNEIPPAYANALLETLDSLAQREPRLSVVVTDRLARRPVDSKRWAIATIPPLDPSVVRDYLESNPENIPAFVQRPFFLNMAIKHGLESGDEAEWFAAFYRQQLHFDEPSLASCSNAAYQAYRQNRSRSFELEQFTSVTGRPLLDELIAGGVVVKADEGRLYFAHHLFHDYLAARYLSTHPDEWGYEAFDVVTFQAASFDVLSLALEQIEDRDAADRFVRLVFDWNPYAPAYVIARSAASGESRVSQDMQFAIGAMLAERSWDPIKASAQRAVDALLLLGPILGPQFLETASFEELRSLVREHAMENEHFDEWKRVFLTDSTDDAEALFGVLGKSDSLLGWAAANALRRIELQSSILEALRGLAERGDTVVRWRAVHALGAHPSATNAGVLADRLLDDQFWVRYGAIRAIVEMAARDSDVRQFVLERLHSSLDAIVEGGVVEELASSLELRDIPTGWLEFAEPLIEEFWLEADTVDLQDQWRKLAYRLEETAGTP